MTPDDLPVAIRAWSPPPPATEPKADRRLRTAPELPGHVLVFDCETTVDANQSLTFGSYRHCRVVDHTLVCIDEGLIYADDLPRTDPQGFAVLCAYAQTNRAATTGTHRALKLMSRTEFVDKVFFKLAYKARAAVVGFNLPFDISRIAVDATHARGDNRGGFSFVLHPGKNGHRENRHRPRLVIKTLAANRTVMTFTSRFEPDDVDLIPQGSVDGRPDPKYVWRGQFIDLRTLVFSLTGELVSLQAACERFGVAGKRPAGEHGVISDEYISYNRHDVAATAGLYEAVIAEFDRHPIQLAADKSFSPASLAKGYLEAMAVTPPLEQNPNFSDVVLGHSMAAFYGGRAECRIRKTPLPVTLVDFTSMYPFVNALMGMWRHLTAERIDPVDATDDVRQLLATVTLDGCFDRAFWPQLNCIVEIQPDGHDLFPVRAKYDGENYTTGINPLHGPERFWYPLADCVASTLLTGRPPTVVRATRFVAIGRQQNLRSTRLRGETLVDPTTDDFFIAVVEARQRAKQARGKRADADPMEQFLKTIANAGSYGIHCELHRTPLPKGKRREVAVHGRFDEPFTAKVTAPEEPGRWFFAPHAAVITGAARLMLAMLQRCVQDAGGTYAFCDTDSMAIVTKPTGSGTSLPNGITGISRQKVTAIQSRFDQLNPYGSDVVPRILKTEAVGLCYAVASKRYAIYQIKDGDISFGAGHKYSEHGLGHLQDPDPTGDPWIRQFWTHTLREVHGLPSLQPSWYDLPALARTTLTTTTLLDAISKRAAPYRNRVKPFNFLTTAPAARPPSGTGDHGFRLVAHWEPDSALWDNLDFKNVGDVLDQAKYKVSTDWSEPQTASVDSYSDYLGRHLQRHECKSTPRIKANLAPGTGLLTMRPIRAIRIDHIGKEGPAHSAEQHTTSMTYGAGNDLALWADIRGRIADPTTRRLASDATGYCDRQLRRIHAGSSPPPSVLVAWFLTRP